MDKKTYEVVRKKYGRYASWAIWNQDEDQIADTEIIERNIEALHSRVVMVGLNISAKLERDWANFRGFNPNSDSNRARPGSHDRKLRRAFNNHKRCRGAYMTDLIKGVCEGNAQEVVRQVKSGEIDICEQIRLFKKEMETVSASGQTLFILFGRDVKRLFESHLSKSFPRFVHLRHYSSRGTDTGWEEDALAEL